MLKLQKVIEFGDSPLLTIGGNKMNLRELAGKVASRVRRIVATVRLWPIQILRAIITVLNRYATKICSEIKRIATAVWLWPIRRFQSMRSRLSAGYASAKSNMSAWWNNTAKPAITKTRRTISIYFRRLYRQKKRALIAFYQRSKNMLKKWVASTKKYWDEKGLTGNIIQSIWIGVGTCFCIIFAIGAAMSESATASWMFSLLLLFSVWYLCGFNSAREDERVVKIFFGKPYAVAESGIYWIPFLLARVRRYTTKVVELNFVKRDAEGNVVINADGKEASAGGFISKKDHGVGSVNIGVTISFRFNWPKDENKLFTCVKMLPDPERLDQLTDIFQEVILDEVRAVGCQMTYVEIMADRRDFAEKILKQAKDKKGLVSRSKIADVRVIINHIDIPKEVLDAIGKEESSRLTAAGAIKVAEGEGKSMIIRGKAKKTETILLGEGDKQKTILQGQGDKQARTDVFGAIEALGETGLALEQLLTAREMGKGAASKIYLPLGAIEKALSGKIAVTPTP